MRSPSRRARAVRTSKGRTPTCHRAASRWPSSTSSSAPFPWQATNAQSLLASMEGLFLLVLVLTSGSRLVAAAGALLRTPYLIFCGCYTVLFVYGFSSFANFGQAQP